MGNLHGGCITTILNRKDRKACLPTGRGYHKGSYSDSVKKLCALCGKNLIIKVINPAI